MNLSIFLNQPFNFFNTKRKKWLYILSSTVFAPIFLIIFQPYGLSEEIDNPINSLSSILLFFLSVSITVFVGLSFSQFLVRKWFNFEDVSIKKYIGWFFLEALGLVSLNFIASFFIPDLGNDFEKELNLIFQIQIYFKAIFVLLFPFLGCIVYISIKDLNYEIKDLEDQLKTYRNSFNTSQKQQLLNFKDENDNLDFTLELKDFLFVEASNQYILIYYLDQELVKKHIIRNRMKNFLLQIESMPIIQCHRSYAVNLLNVRYKVKKHGKFALLINCFEPQYVPVSKSYLDIIDQRLS